MAICHPDYVEILNIGTGHGVLYQPLDEWILPVVQWANENAE